MVYIYIYTSELLATYKDIIIPLAIYPQLLCIAIKSMNLCFYLNVSLIYSHLIPSHLEFALYTILHLNYLFYFIISKQN